MAAWKRAAIFRCSVESEMITEFPTLVYRCPGNHQRAGGTYDYVQVKDAAELDSRRATGWSATLIDAITPHVADAPVLPDDAPPTRAELETKARELGIKVDGRYSDRKLLQLIAAALVR